MNRKIDTAINVIALFFTAIFALYADRYLDYFPDTNSLIHWSFAAVVAFGGGVLLRYTMIAYTNLRPFRKLLDPSSYFEGVWFGTIVFDEIQQNFVATIRFNQKTKAYELFGQGFDSEAKEISEFRSSIFEYVKSQDRAIFALDNLRRDSGANSGYLFGIISFSFWSKASPDHARGTIYDSANSLSGQIQLSRVQYSEINEITGSYGIQNPEDAKKIVVSKASESGTQS